MAFLFFADGNTVFLIVGIAALVIGLAAAVVSVIVSVKTGRRVPREKGPSVSEREVPAEEYLEEMEMVGDNCVLARNVVYSVGDDGQLAAGTYRLTSATSDDDKFNIRLNGLVRETESGSTVVLGAGDTICAVSHSVVLEKI